ncbi:MAG: roadblock/LC7 domain-containing protein [bacterium]|jgi:predicted regulator of Ras-like GTPase activity (Roadblock/LC7/MglB family)|nr:roadblock/LC7 domain-containing protein [candidate division KSB1 bacterium]MDH7560407.1 roadblock/LC7 domain-containing protein [bacterium]
MDLAPNADNRRILLSESNYAEIRSIVTELVTKTRARTIVFADMNGHPICQGGARADLDIASLTALAAGEFSATAEIARLLGEPGKFRLLFHEGTRGNVYIASVGGSYLLLIVFEPSVALGIVRVFANKAVALLNRILEEARRAEEEAARFLDMEFGELLKRELERSFRG